MTKIGTAHVEVKPVLNEEALAAIADLVERSVESAVSRAFETAFSKQSSQVRIVRVYGSGVGLPPDELEAVLNKVRADGDLDA